MAIYRPEQAQLTYGPEAAFAGDAELANGAAVSSGWTGDIAAAAAGSLEVSLTQDATNTADPNIGDFIQIGATTGTYSQSIGPHEIRRIEWWEPNGDTRGYTLGLDRPLGFDHSTTASRDTKEVDGIYVGSNYNNSKAITSLPGVYETVDAPDMESGMEPQFFLGTNNKRSFQTVVKNQQIYDSALTMTPLDAKPLRWSIGKVTTCAEDMTYSNSRSTLGGFSELESAAKKGDMILHIKEIAPFGTVSGGVITEGTRRYLTLLDTTTHTNTTTNASNTDTAVAAMGSNPESRRVMHGYNPTGDIGYLWLDQPLQFDHVVGTIVAAHGAISETETFRHVISETTGLDTMSWHIHMKDSDERGKTTAGTASDVPSTDFDFDRRYTGGKVGSTTISAEESGLLSVSWDTISFRGMHHNNRNHAGLTTSDTVYNGANVTSNMPFFSLMQDIQMSDVDYPDTEPYYFSDGQLKFFGTTFASIRSFSLSANNNVEPRYYVQRSFGRFRGPNELREQRREYGLTATVVLPDNADNMLTGAVDNATALFRELLLEGDYGKPSNDKLRGFTASLRFDRGTNDYIIIDIPASQASGNAGKPHFNSAGTPGTNHGDSTTQDVGLFIRSAAHNLTTDAPMQVELDMFFKNLVIYIKDNEPSYI